MKQSGFTIIELIITMILTTLLAGVVAKIIAGPIQSYFWGARIADLTQMGEQALDLMAKECQLALKSTLQVEKRENSQEMRFRKIEYKGLTHSTDASKWLVIGKLPSALFSELGLMVYFPFKEDEQLIPVILKSEESGDYLIFHQALPQDKRSQPFYLLSGPIRYEWDEKTTLLKRLGSSTSLLANHVQHCDFEFSAHHHPAVLLVSLQLGGRKTQPLTMIQPMMVGKP